MSVYDGQKANQGTFNGAFGSKMADNTYAGIQALNNPASGEMVLNIQGLLNKLLVIAGTTEVATDSLTYAEKNYIADDDSHKAAIEKLDAAILAVNGAVNALAKPTYQVQAAQTVAEGGQLAEITEGGFHMLLVSGDTAAVSLNVLPFVDTANMPDGCSIRLVGTDDINTVTIKHNDNVNGSILNGDAVLKKYCTIEIVWNATLQRFIEMGRNF